jgi:hypothetical protein
MNNNYFFELFFDVLTIDKQNIVNKIINSGITLLEIVFDN